MDEAQFQSSLQRLAMRFGLPKESWRSYYDGAVAAGASTAYEALIAARDAYQEETINAMYAECPTSN